MALLAGCVTRPVVAPPVSTDMPVPDTFRLSGRATVKYDNGAEYLRFDWAAQSGRDSILLNSPIGTNVAAIEVTAQQAIFRKGQEEYVADDAEELMWRMLGWSLPVQGLHYWILGLAAPGTPAKWQATENGWTLMQAGWQMHFSEYVEAADGTTTWRVPKHIDASNPGFAIKIVINDWRFGPEPGENTDVTR